MPSRALAIALPLIFAAGATAAEEPTPLFHRHVAAVLSKLGCNGGHCHGAVQGRNGFRLSLFGGDTVSDYDQVARGVAGRRVNRYEPDLSLILLKGTGRVPHGGGIVTESGSPEYNLLRRWIAAGSPTEPVAGSRVRKLSVEPAERVTSVGGTHRIRVRAEFVDGTAEDVTALCSFVSLDPKVAEVTSDGEVRGAGVGDTAVIVRYRSDPIMSLVAVPRSSAQPSATVKPNNFIDEPILAKLRRLNIAPAATADDAVFLRRASLDVCGELPTPDEIRAFLADRAPDKRNKKIEELLARPGHAALWTLKFCDILKASDYGVYADGISQEADAPRFQAWVRKRMEENTPYDEFVERIITATSREGATAQAWADDMLSLHQEHGAGRPDTARYARRKTLDLYWNRRGATGISGALQVSHAFLGLRLDCAQCHRHPHDVWRQEDLLEFANFFSRVSKTGFSGDNEKKRTEVAAIRNGWAAEGKKLEANSKTLKDEIKKLDAQAKTSKAEIDKLTRELAAAQAGPKADEAKKRLDELKSAAARHESIKKEAGEAERKSKMLTGAGTRILHSEVYHVPDGKLFTTVVAPNGTHKSERFRLLGSSEPITVKPEQDPRALVAAWMRKPDNPWFARAIVNRVWAHYFGRGIIDPPDNLSVFSPASHPELLAELSARFVREGYDLRKLHRWILASRTYQQSGTPTPGAQTAGAGYAFFALRRLPAEVFCDALDQATGVREKMEMTGSHWPADIRCVEVPFAPKNDFVNFVLSNFGKPPRNSANLCDCERDMNTSMLQVLGLANHPRLRQKITDPAGRAALIAKTVVGEDKQLDELFLGALSRLPTAAEREGCREYLKKSPSPAEGLAGVLWSLVNTREFLLQH